MKPQFIHLRLHTDYSLVDGIVKIKALIKTIANQGMPAVAVTDHMNLFGLVKFYRAAITSGIKPIIGVDTLIYNETATDKPFTLTLFAQNHEGYKNITRLISRAYTQQKDTAVPMLEPAWFTENTAGIIALSGARFGNIGQALLAKKTDLAEQRLKEWLNLFPERFYIELQRTGRMDEENYIHAVLPLAEKYQVPVVATNEVCFLKSDDFEAHEARVCINSGHVLNDPNRPSLHSNKQYLRSAVEMSELFADIPSALANTVEIAKRCNLELTLDQYFLPQFPIPDGITLEDYFAEQARSGLAKQLAFNGVAQDVNTQALYAERLNMELNVINSMGFAGYFLIVADFIRWSKENAIPVGPGRGSGAGSLVAYALGITGLDPIEHELLFERFLNPERVSMPDFDIDFCMEGRDRVIDYVAKKYGRESVSQIITYGTMAAKAVVRDVGRVLGHPYGFVDKIAKLIPFELGITLTKALEQEEALRNLYNQEEEVKYLIDLALKLEGTTRNAGKHAGGVVIAPSLLTDFAPLYCEKGSEGLVTQFDKDDVEAVGLVKFDFLGLRTLTIIDWALTAINAKRKLNNQDIINIDLLPLQDNPTFNLLKACATTAVFQLESRGMKDLIKRLQPDNFDEIVALVALFRPGPLQSGMVDDFIDRKHGRAVVEYPHPKLEPILRSTYGVILYQEQVMQIAQVLAGYSLGKADLLRRAMGKKKPEEMAKQRAIFVDGAVSNHVDASKANQIFDLMEKFAGYGFNKSHSAAYAVLSFQTAWLKTHYPAEFMAAVLSSDMDNTDKVVNFIEECKRMRLKITMPNVNVGQYKFTVDVQGRIVYGLGAIKGVGEAALENIIAERNNSGAFKDLFDFCQRVDTRKVNKRVFEALIKAGAFDCFGVHRACLEATLPSALHTAEQHHRNNELGQHTLFDLMSPAQTEKHDVKYISVPEWSDIKRLENEKQTLGLYLSGHPLTQYEHEIKHFTSASISELNPGKKNKAMIAGLVIGFRTMISKSGNKLAFLTLEDKTARIDIAIFGETYNQYRELLVKDTLLIVEGEVSVDDFSGGNKIRAERILTLDQVRQIYAKRLLIKLSEAQSNDECMIRLQSILQPFKGGNCPVFITYQNQQAKTQIQLGAEWNVRPAAKLVEELCKFLDKDAINLLYV